MGELAPPVVTPVNETLTLGIPSGDLGSGRIVKYTFTSTTGAQWLEISAFGKAVNDSTRVGAAKGRDLKLLDLSQHEFHEFVLGKEPFEKMIRNRVNSAWMRRVTGTVWSWRVNGDNDESANLVWSGKALTPSPTQWVGVGDEANTIRTPSSTSTTNTQSGT